MTAGDQYSYSLLQMPPITETTDWLCRSENPKGEDGQKWRQSCHWKKQFAIAHH
jgi:hypothetical protein